MLATTLLKRSLLLLTVLLFGITCGAANCKSIAQLNMWETQGVTLGSAVQAADGLIWSGSLNGHLRRYDPRTPNGIVSERKMQFGVGAIHLTKVESAGGKELIVVAHGNGLNCYGTDGAALSIQEALGTTFSTPGIAWKDQILFVGEDSLFWRFNSSDLSAKMETNGPRTGALTCAPCLLQVPEPVLVFGGKTLGNILTREYKYLVTMVPVSGPNAGRPKAIDLERTLGIVVFRPTAVTVKNRELAFMVTDEGKILIADGEQVNFSPVFDLKTTPHSPVIQMKDNNLCVLGFESHNSSYTKTIFTPDGKLVSKSTIRDSSATAINSKPVSEPALVEDSKGNICVLQGFADRILRLIDLENGRVEATLQTKKLVTNRPSQLTATDFFVSEEEGDLPLNMTNQYLIRVKDD